MSINLQWFRMYHEFASDPKVQMLSEPDQRRYVMLLCLRCSNGSVTLHDDEVAFQLRISNEEWTRTKETLIAKKLIDSDCQPIAWDKRQYVSDSSSKRVAAHRERKKKEAKQACNVTVTPPDTDTDTDTDIKSIGPAEEISAQSVDERQRLPISMDWEPEHKTLAVLCRKSNMPIELITSDMVTNFKLWFIGKTTVATTTDWNARLVKWALSEIAKQKANPARTTADLDSTDWRHKAGESL